MNVPTRALSVDEPALFASDTGCRPALDVAVADSCKRCGPIVIWRGSERVATLLAAPSVAPPPVPERMRPAYTTPGRDANRHEAHLPLVEQGDALRFEGACAIEIAAIESGIETSQQNLQIDGAVTRACKTVSVEVECR